MDLKRKEKQVKDLQNRLDSGEGCKFTSFFIKKNKLPDARKSTADTHQLHVAMIFKTRTYT